MIIKFLIILLTHILCIKLQLFLSSITHVQNYTFINLTKATNTNMLFWANTLSILHNITSCAIKIYISFLFPAKFTIFTKFITRESETNAWRLKWRRKLQNAIDKTVLPACRRRIISIRAQISDIQICREISIIYWRQGKIKTF